MRLVLVNNPLEKGRKPLPEGTLRVYGGMKFQKKGGKWVYFGGGEKPLEETTVEEPVAEKTDELIWDAVSVPTRAYLEQEIRKQAEAVFLGGLPDDIVKTMADLGIGYDPKYGGGKNAVLSELKDIAQGKHANWQELANKLHLLFGEKQYSREISTLDCESWASLYHYYSNMISAAYLDDATFDGKLRVHHTYPQKEGLSVTFNSNIGALPALIVPWGQMESFLYVYCDEATARKGITGYKKTNQYREWQVSGGDPTLRTEVENFTAEVDLEMDATSLSWYGGPGWGGGKGKTQLKPEYVRTLKKLFKEMSAVVDFKSYEPADGKKLRVRVSGAGKKYAGFYTESDNSINIAPSMPGTLAHEIGHYFFYRGGPELEKEFMAWVENIGLKKKIENAVAPAEFTPEEIEKHVLEVVQEHIHIYDGYIEDWPTVQSVFNKTAIDGLHDYLTAAGQHLIEEVISLPKNGLFKRLLGMTDVEFIRGLRLNHLQGTLADRDTEPLVNNLVAFKHAYENLDTEGKEVFDVFAAGFMTRATRRTRESLSSSFYQENKDYWGQPTEIFARVFRCYCAFKAGKSVNEIDKKGVLGWGFAAVDPSDMTMQMEHENLKAMYQKYFGEKVVKSMEKVCGKRLGDS